MSVANDKASKKAAGLVMEFLSPNKGKTNGPDNYLAWAGVTHTTMGAHYVPMARVFNDQVPYVVPDLEADNVHRTDNPGMEGLSAANLDAIRVSVISAHVKKKRELRDKLPKFLNDILLEISFASRLLIEAD
jgi:hypothetical protein